MYFPIQWSTEYADKLSQIKSAMFPNEEQHVRNSYVLCKLAERNYPADKLKKQAEKIITPSASDKKTTTLVLTATANNKITVYASELQISKASVIKCLVGLGYEEYVIRSLSLLEKVEKKAFAEKDAQIQSLVELIESKQAEVTELIVQLKNLL